MRSSGSFSVGQCLVALALLASSVCAAESIAGRVFERVGDRVIPLRKALVSAASPDGQQTFAVTRTDGEGRYLLADQMPRRLRLRAEKFGYLIISAGGKKQPELNVSCVESGCGPFDFELVKGAVVAGTVFDDLNEPVASAHIWLLAPGSDPMDATQLRGDGRSDDRGQFRIIGLPEGAYELRGAIGGRGGGHITLRSAPVPIEVAAGEQISGISLRLEDMAGAAFTVAGRLAGFDLSSQGDHLLWMRPLRQTLHAGPRYGSHMYRLARDGAFSIEQVPPGDYVFTYGHNPRAGLEKRFSLGIIKVEGELRGLTLEPLDPSGFRGRVESDGSELPNQVSVVFVRADHSSVSARADTAFPDFTFRETQLLPGTYNLSARGHDFYIKAVRIGDQTLEPQGITVRSGEIREIVLILSSEFAAVRGRVKPSRERRDEEQEAAHYRVGLEGPGGVVSAQTDQHGAFAFEGLVPGPYRICAWSDRAPEEIDEPALWESASAAARGFPVEPGSEIEIELTAVE
ncbi:MAG: carboxypeptidase-like regulatory domain-containing protein [Acidobacteria bacterium]|nr:carboxypeptidase-like regulatory domain-containing protein [Acidobacteriota bacterium]